MRRILDQYQTHGIFPTWTEVGLTNGTPLMSAYWEKDGAGNAVGWQCQGNQWRLAMILKSMAGRRDGPGRARAAYAASQSGWFEYEPLCEILEHATTISGRTLARPRWTASTSTTSTSSTATVGSPHTLR